MSWSRRVGTWRIWLSRLVAWEEAIGLSADEVQDRRIDRLEREVAALRASIPATRETMAKSQQLSA